MKAKTGFVPVSVLLFLLIQCGYAETRVREEGRLPLYIRKARELLLRQKAYQTTQDRRMEILSKALSSFAGDLYSHHVNGNQGNGSFGNVLISPMGAFASLAMMLTASRGATKREVAAALALDDITGVHHTLQRAFTSYRRDDSHEIDNDVSDGAWDDAGKGEYTGPSHDDLEDIMRNDYIIDNSISYSAGQTNLMFSDGSIASAHSHSPQRQMNTADDDLQDTIAIRFANGMFHNEDVGLSQRFIMRLASLYGVPPMAMQQSDPEDSVNLWVDAATYGAISRVLESGSLDEDTSLVLISATYFRAGWQERFNEKLLSRVTLHVDDGKPRDDVDDSVRVGVTDDETVFGPESDNGTGETDKDRENDESDHYHLLYPTADDDLDEYEGDYDYGED
nr:hypothetical protein BaRGS_033798 [Batillaria attramentaria]